MRKFFPTDLLKFKRSQSGIITPRREPLKVCVALCVHRGIDPEAYKSLEALRYSQDPIFVTYFHVGDALIDRARSQVATRFLESGKFDVLLFLDDDIAYEPDAPVKVAKLIHDNGLDICGAAYVKKQSEGNHFNIKTLDDEPLVFGEGAGVEEVRCISGGFMGISMKVLKKLAETLPLCHPNDLRFYPFFQPYPKEIENSDGTKTMIYLSEDWAICERARDAGFKVWVDCTTKLTHVGKYKYDWNDIFRDPKPDVKTFNYGDINGQAFSEKVA